ncbi:hypothetical protein HMPREF1586_01230, partial [Gardnerella vaginalis JCP8522]
MACAVFVSHTIPHFVPNLTKKWYKKRKSRSCRSRGLSARTSS